MTEPTIAQLCALVSATTYPVGWHYNPGDRPSYFLDDPRAAKSSKGGHSTAAANRMRAQKKRAEKGRGK